MVTIQPSLPYLQTDGLTSGQWSAVIADEPHYASSRAELPTGRRTTLLIKNEEGLNGRFLHSFSVLVVGMTILPGVTPCGLTPGCDMVPFQSTNG